MPCSKGVVSQHALQVVSQHALQVSRGILQAHTQGEVEESGQGYSPGPHPGGKLRGLARGDLQAHTQGGSPGPHPGGSPGPHPGGPQAHTGGSPDPHPGGCIIACTEADPHGWLLPWAVHILLECILV